MITQEHIEWTAFGARHLYIHVPFCPAVCGFCNFHVTTIRGNQLDAYVRALREELRSIARADRWLPGSQSWETIYLGGGTPSLLTQQHLKEIFEEIAKWNGVTPQEVTVEAHPTHVHTDNIKVWEHVGVTRLSIGAQSFFPDRLTALGRDHTAAESRSALACAVESPFDVNVDVIVGVPDTNAMADLEFLATQDIAHYAIYGLTIEPQTPFARRGVMVDPDHCAQEMLWAASLLSVHDFDHYEVSNYAKPGKRCHHNLGYWADATWLGIGPSASSRLRSHGAPDDRQLVRRVNARLSQWPQNSDSERLSVEETVAERLISGLRLLEGFSFVEFCATLPLSKQEQLNAAVMAAINTGHLEKLHHGYVRIHRDHWTTLDAVTARIIDGLLPE